MNRRHDAKILKPVPFGGILRARGKYARLPVGGAPADGAPADGRVARRWKIGKR